ncbi:MAG TPA: hypothetical protein DDZ82_07320 [Rhodobacteraceae bacterium]|nr:hypothetical protein [Paracoccaceae bacterium]HBM68618.1 hypothetical protein [Paracoccaceae bacterium]
MFVLPKCFATFAALLNQQPKAKIQNHKLVQYGSIKFILDAFEFCSTKSFDNDGSVIGTD